MIEPYRAALQACKKQFDSLGFKLVEDSSHAQVFEKGDFRLSITAERYGVDFPSIELRYSPVGVKSSLGAWKLMGAISPDTQEKIRNVKCTDVNGVEEVVRTVLIFFQENEDVIFRYPLHYDLRKRYQGA